MSQPAFSPTSEMSASLTTCTTQIGKLVEDVKYIEHQINASKINEIFKRVRDSYDQNLEITRKKIEVMCQMIKVEKENNELLKQRIAEAPNQNLAMQPSILIADALHKDLRADPDKTEQEDHLTSVQVAEEDLGKNAKYRSTLFAIYLLFKQNFKPVDVQQDFYDDRNALKQLKLCLIFPALLPAIVHQLGAREKFHNFFESLE